MDTHNIKLKSTGEDETGTNITAAHDFLTRALDLNGQFIIWMRGLPYKCTAGEVVEYFRSGLNRCEVLEDDVLIVKKKNGDCSGDAFVLFANKSDAQVALNKHRQLFGRRYIELFLSTDEKLQQVLDREAQASINTPMSSAPPLLPQYAITCGTQKDCIRLHGMPYLTKVENILQFLGEHAKNISFQGVHMIYNSNGKPSGNAFIQMKSKKSAYDAARTCHRKTMMVENGLCYVDVIQCSGDDTQSALISGQLCSKVDLNPGFETSSDVRLIQPTFYSEAPAQQAPDQEARHVDLATTYRKSQYAIPSPGYVHCPPLPPLPQSFCHSPLILKIQAENQAPAWHTDMYSANVQQPLYVMPHQYLMQQETFQPLSPLCLPQPIYPLDALIGLWNRLFTYI